MKIVIIGAGSLSFGRGQIVDILSSKMLKNKNLQLCLVDKDEKTMQIMGRLAEKIKIYFNSDAIINWTTDRREALPNADYVLIAVAVKRLELWEQDFRVPLSYGFKHCLGENGGPGAMFHALRSFNLLIPICRDMEKLCPAALLFNFTNPEARVLNAIQSLTKVKSYGLCHGVFAAIDCLEHYLKKNKDQLRYKFGGMNHFYTLLELKDKATGEDLKQKLFDLILTDESGHAPPLFKSMIKHFGMMSYPSDDHVGEYVSYGTEYSGTKWHYGIESRKVVLQQKDEYQGGTTNSSQRDKNWELMEKTANGELPLDTEATIAPSGEVSIKIIEALENDTELSITSVNTMNTEKYIDNLPSYGVVEVPATVDGKGIHPEKVGSMPESIAAMIHPHMRIHRLLVEAYDEGSKAKLLEALLLDPVVNSIEAAKAMLDEMLELQSEFLPEFK